MLKTLAVYRLVDPGSEWRLHRQWYDASAMADLLDADFALAEKNTLYRCLDRLVEHKDALFQFLKQRWGELFGARFDVLLYDLTSTYFESDTPRGPEDLRQYGYSRDKRGDCRQVAIALIVTPEGFPLSYEVLAGNRTDNGTLSEFLDRIESRYGHARRIWVMDRGIPTEASLAKMRAMGAAYLVGTPKGRLMMKVGAARQEAGRAASLVRVSMPKGEVGTEKTAGLAYRLDRDKPRQVRRREGRYLLRTNLVAHAPGELWTFYVQLTEVEQAFKELKHDLSVRPIYHHDEHRIEAHIFVSFLAYCLQVTLKARLKVRAAGLTLREALAQFKTMQMVDVRIPTADGRELVLSRYTQPQAEQRMLLDQLGLRLPEQPPPRITTAQLALANQTPLAV